MHPCIPTASILSHLPAGPVPSQVPPARGTEDRMHHSGEYIERDDRLCVRFSCSMSCSYPVPQPPLARHMPRYRTPSRIYFRWLGWRVNIQHTRVRLQHPDIQTRSADPREIPYVPVDPPRSCHPTDVSRSKRPNAAPRCAVSAEACAKMRRVASRGSYTCIRYARVVPTQTYAALRRAPWVARRLAKFNRGMKCEPTARR